MAHILHWTGVALVLLVLALGIRAFLRGLSTKPSDPQTRVADPWWRGLGQ